MKKIIAIACSLIVGVLSMTFSTQAVTAEPESHSNVLIAYFSRAGENYSVGVIEKGNTELLAEIIADETNGDLFRIEPVVPYPEGYEDTKTIATQERTDNARPEIKNTIEKFDDYDVIFVGYPIWWGDMPMIMYTFLESYDWTGKVVIPFNTHEGSGQAQTVSAIRKECSGASVMNGFSVRGSVAQNNGETARETAHTWLSSNHFSEIAENKMVYSLQDIRNLQDFLLTRPTEEELTGKLYDLDHDGVWSVFDLCLMKRVYLNANTVDAVSSATVTE